LTQKVLIKTLLQSLSRRCLGVDGQGELVDDNDEHEDQSGDGGGKGDVPALNGSPGERLGDGSGSGSSVNGVSSGGLDRGGINELAARSVNASFSIILEGLDDSNVDEEAMMTEMVMRAQKRTATTRVKVIPTAKMSLLRMRSKKKVNKRVKRMNPAIKAIKTKA